MSYLCGLGPSMRAFGEPPREPAIVCDGCGERKSVLGYPTLPKWFLRNKPPPGWKGLRMRNGEKSWDLRPRCWTSGTGKRKEGES